MKKTLLEKIWVWKVDAVMKIFRRTARIKFFHKAAMSFKPLKKYACVGKKGLRTFAFSRPEYFYAHLIGHAKKVRVQKQSACSIAKLLIRFIT